MSGGVKFVTGSGLASTPCHLSYNTFIMELDYHWLLDFAGSLVVTPHGAKYVLVMAKHFNK